MSTCYVPEQGILSASLQSTRLSIEYHPGAPLRWMFVIMSAMLDHHCEGVCNDEYYVGAPL